MAECEVLIY